jgi:hypothetical protein
MSTVGFCTPITFGNFPKSFSQDLLEAVDGYFFYGGRKACVIEMGNRESQVVLYQKTSSIVLTCLKVASIFTLIIPLIALIAKAILRCMHTYKLSFSVDIESLGLDLKEQDKMDKSTFTLPESKKFIPVGTFTLRDAVEYLIDKIGEQIRRKSNYFPNSPLQAKHRILLNTGTPWEHNGSNLYFYENFCGTSSKTCFPTEDERKKLWLSRIIKALEEKNYIKVNSKVCCPIPTYIIEVL